MDCGALPKSLLQILSEAVYKDDSGDYFLNVTLTEAECDDLLPLINCDNTIPELNDEIASEDDCGNKSIRIRIPISLSDLSDVEDSVFTDGQFLKYDDINEVWDVRDDWDDLRITPGSFDRPGISDPAYVPYFPNGGGLSVYLPEFAKGDFASFTIQLPHGYHQGEDIYVHIHWTPRDRGNEEIGKTVGWKIDYTWANINGTFSDMQTADLSDVCDGTDHKHQMTPEVLISGNDKHISSMLLCNVRRSDTGTDDTWASASSGELPLLLEVDFHYPMDTQGSKTNSQK